MVSVPAFYFLRMTLQLLERLDFNFLTGLSIKPLGESQIGKPRLIVIVPVAAKQKTKFQFWSSYLLPRSLKLTSHPGYQRILSERAGFKSREELKLFSAETVSILNKNWAFSINEVKCHTTREYFHYSLPFPTLIKICQSISCDRCTNSKSKSKARLR